MRNELDVGRLYGLFAHKLKWNPANGSIVKAHETPHVWNRIAEHGHRCRPDGSCILLNGLDKKLVRTKLKMLVEKANAKAVLKVEIPNDIAEAFDLVAVFTKELFAGLKGVEAVECGWFVLVKLDVHVCWFALFCFLFFRLKLCASQRLTLKKKLQIMAQFRVMNSSVFITMRVIIVHAAIFAASLLRVAR